jgi:hypothetical protein
VTLLGARSDVARAAAVAGYLAAVTLHVLLQEVGLRLRREESRAWWAGTGRDVLNGVGFAAVAVALRAYGFPGGAALYVAATATLILFGTSIFLETQVRVRHRRAWAVTLGLAVSTPVLVIPERVIELFQRAAASLFALPG